MKTKHRRPQRTRRIEIFVPASRLTKSLCDLCDLLCCRWRSLPVSADAKGNGLPSRSEAKNFFIFHSAFCPSAGIRILPSPLRTSARDPSDLRQSGISPDSQSSTGKIHYSADRLFPAASTIIRSLAYSPDRRNIRSNSHYRA
jgi:hypothetical protein